MAVNSGTTSADDHTRRWEAHPILARVIRIGVFLVPITGSVVFVHFASRVVQMPTRSLLLFILWWAAMSGSATVVLVLLDRVSRRLLPLVALYRLSLVFPDQAPSRFNAAFRSNTVETLEQRLARARKAKHGSTAESAAVLLELAAQLDVHDRLTRGHCERVRAYAQLIGKELGLKRRELDALNWASLLHDVGKLYVPYEILNKPGKPTADEWKVLRRHPEFGEELVEPLRGWLGPWSQVIGQHHERWDGAGYPRNLSGEEISLGARIVSVADVFDVITSARSYKTSSASAIAREEIARCAGTQFDPRVVRAFLNVSLGRLRFVMGPLSWLTHAPVLARIPLTPAIGTATLSLATLVGALTTGVLSTPPTPVLASNAPAVASAVGKSDPISRSTPEGTSVVVGVEEVGPGGKVASLSVLREPADGRVRVTANHQLEFTPPAGFTGKVTVPYEACWPNGSCRRGVVVVTVTPVNDPPVARADAAVSNGGVPVMLDVLANDSDPEGGRLSLVSVSDVVASRSQVLNRIVLPAGAGSRAARASVEGRRIRFTPASGFAGTATFTYTIRDDEGGRATALVKVKVTAPPKSAAPAQSEGEPQPAAPAGGSETPADASGGASDDTSSPAPEPAVVAPVAVGDRVSVPQGASVLVDVLANDTGESALSLVSVGDPARGTAVKAGNRVRFTAPEDFVGAVSFPYTIADADGGGDRGTVSVTVLLVNVAPSFTPGPGQSVPQNAGAQTVPGWATEIDPGAPSEADQTVSFLVVVDNPGLFSVQPQLDAAGTLTYMPAAGTSGTATVTVRARDDGGTARGGSDTSAPARFTITVTPPPTAPANRPPVANVDVVSVAQDSTLGVSFDVLANDTDPDFGDSRLLASYDGSTIVNGTLTHGTAGSFTYVPIPGFTGSEAFSYTVADGAGATATAIVTVTVTPVPHPPVAGDDAYLAQANTQLVAGAPGLLANDGDPDGGDTITLQTTAITGPANGTVVIDPLADGRFSYMPALGFVGTDSFTYRIADTTGRTADGTVTITVGSGVVVISTLYLQPTGPTADIWDLTATAAPAAAPLADFDLDGNPGLTIRRSGSGIATPARYQVWTFTSPVPVMLNGPATLDLWGAAGMFGTAPTPTLDTFLYACTPGGAADPAWAGCSQIAVNTTIQAPWNTSPSGWSRHLVNVGNVGGQIVPAGYEIRLEIRAHGPADLWLTMSAASPTALTLTLG